MKEKQILDKVLGPAVYDRRIRPGRGNITDGKKINLANVQKRHTDSTKIKRPGHNIPMH